MEYNLKELRKKIIADKKDYESFKKTYLGTDGFVKKALDNIKDIPKEEKASYGKEINDIKQLCIDILEKKRVGVTQKNNEKIDPTAPFDINTAKDKRPEILDLKGSKHPIHKEVERFIEIFKSMGFDVMESRQLDDDYHMFESLNFPKGHPARDMYDTFWTEDNFVLPAHTSTMQNRAMKEFGPPPIRAVLPGRCFRNEATDASHEHTFYQIEGVYVDEGISVGNMQATIKAFLEAYLEKELEVRIQPSFFPFTEPDCEFVIGCPFCSKAGCSVCGHSGWIELMGCGMIHPNVLSQAGIDPEKYSGFAWGFGVDRLTMIKLGIDDIRYLRDSNLNFLKQF
ncbi:MAG: phenylalanine--tRNA ligase subunit alpha [Candidatus Dojkabacteria bacterium]|nr:phenylalanine--tRNA ligase subunit alpha [Candidatus Dojkabacteria bacterium]